MTVFSLHIPQDQRRLRRSRWALTALLVMTTGCAQPQGGLIQPDPEPAIQLSAQPGTLVFSGTRAGTGAGASTVQTVTLQNSTDAPVLLTGVTFSAGTAFGLVSPPTFPLTLDAGASLNLSVKLLPGNPTGVLRATLRAVGEGAVGEVELAGLRAAGLEGDNEPPLAQIVDALDYKTNVGGTGLILGTGAGPIGDEVMAPLFERASSAPVTLRPVARYSPDGLSAYGTFVLAGDAARLQVLGTMALGSHQALNPPLVAGSQTTFDPGSQPFGIYLAANGKYPTQDTYTLDRLNTGSTRHAVRTYPLKDRAGKVVPNSYLLAFEPSANGDYQDAVFVLENVRPVAAK
ncbi:hypothetical protein [Deinococcus humi]|uniref:Choice-of-anchor D domain-containing protein n=1 Tax=Deinococcus humi TaxID=662880 RepID=A0A7W8JZU6_9DEIO|nr:hypothetical protein [Deinococcus humi]MBB5364659.1 hypothetical protein [Deinococcus humi]GGO34154.1 hypothetical protein GCM10008949_34460 [Deinococcus humi]